MQPGERIKAIPTQHGLVTFGSGADAFEKMVVVFKVLEGPSMNQTVNGSFGFKGKGEDFTAEVMRKCGYNGVNDMEDPWDYQQVLVTIVAEEYESEGKKRTGFTVQYVNALDEAPRDPGALIEKFRADPVRAKSFKETFMASQQAKRAAAGETAAPQAKAVGKPGSKPGAGPDDGFGGGPADEDIPF